MPETKLDLKDRKILRELDRNARMSFNEIGKKLKISPSVVEYRIKNMLGRGIIKGFLTVENYKKFGFTAHLLYLGLQNADQKMEEKIFDYLKQNPYCIHLAACEGRWDMFAGFLAKDFFQLNEMTRELNNKYGQFIRDSSRVTHIGSYHIPRDYLTGAKMQPIHSFIVGEPEETIKAEDENLKLLYLLNHNARMGTIEIAKRLNSTVDKIRYRLKQLKEKNMILSYYLYLDHNKLGYPWHRILLKLKNMNDRKEKELVSYLSQHQNVHRIIKTFGEWDFTIDVEIEHEKFREFLSELRNNLSNIIQNYEVMHIHSEDKLAYFPTF